MTADIKTFWGALVSVLLKCIAALGFATANQTANQTAVRAQAPAALRTKALVGAAATEAGGAAPAPAGPLTPPSTRRADLSVPAPRAGEPQPRRRERDRTLPPTMKQRIRAEAHGSSPSARSLRPGTDLADGGTDQLTDGRTDEIVATFAGAARAAGLADDLALCA
jgi:Family of unknown function (DUF6344)